MWRQFVVGGLCNLSLFHPIRIGCTSAWQSAWTSPHVKREVACHINSWRAYPFLPNAMLVSGFTPIMRMLPPTLLPLFLRHPALQSQHFHLVLLHLTLSPLRHPLTRRIRWVNNSVCDPANPAKALFHQKCPRVLRGRMAGFRQVCAQTFR